MRIAVNRVRNLTGQEIMRFERANPGEVEIPAVDVADREEALDALARQEVVRRARP